ncbi:sugar phosphate permease [Sanguibacter keddieii DSM 10542]|uniref:Sugar phosphate permease n=1 Tax=Sanguibacter keddieii (strain ATCC 51767 / DSM 10542 / NCFB 3025 / ST-74) TaxID=446469 RepID=D1BFM1_SANKS|nr:MFS transporter [Sanguibacter keddieii]ACZ23524.1 sugar phosphate permease [Sanguibacter keddieii DSM 10542]
MSSRTAAGATPSPRTVPDVAVRRARVAVAVLFFTNGAIFANLLPRYPEIKASLDLTNGAFGAAVAAMPLGALVAGLSAGALIRRFGSARVAVTGTMMLGLSLIIAGAAPAWAVLAVGLFIAGAMDAITDVAQNSHGLWVQRLYRRSILNSFHAVWSIGAVSGGIMGAAIAEAGVSTTVHMVISAGLFAVAALLAYRWLLRGPEPRDVEADPVSALPGADQVADAPSTAKPAPQVSMSFALRWGILLALVVIAAAGGVVEDAGSSWAAIYLTGTFGTTAFVASLGFISLQGMQFVGRLLGDRLVDRFGQRAVARTGGVIVFVGTGAALAFPSTVGTIVGFGLAGFGVATLIPAAMHAADQLPGFAPGTGLTIVGWLLRLGFLGAPPLVGAVADASSLRVGLLVLPLAGLLVVVFAQVLSTRQPAGPAEPLEPADEPAAEPAGESSPPA